jgi:hypothetical protein
MPISQHGVAVSSTQHVNGVMVGTATHECNGAAGALRTGDDFRVLNICVVCHGNGGHAKRSGDVGGFDDNTFSIVKI